MCTPIFASRSVSAVAASFAGQNENGSCRPIANAYYIIHYEVFAPPVLGRAYINKQNDITYGQNAKHVNVYIIKIYTKATDVSHRKDQETDQNQSKCNKTDSECVCVCVAKEIELEKKSRRNVKQRENTEKSYLKINHMRNNGERERERERVEKNKMLRYSW